LTEDLQDGRVIAGLKILNPFEDANDAAIDAMLDG
jgi:predicted nucleic acid-binding protein